MIEGQTRPNPSVAIVREAFRTFSSQGGRLLAAAIAFNALLSLIPLLLLVLKFAALFTDQQTARATLLKDLTRWVGPDGSSTIGDLLSRAQSSGAQATVLGAVVLAWGSTRLFGALRRSLDMLWGTASSMEETMRNKAERFLEHRLRGFFFIVVIGALLVVLAFAHAAIAVVREATDMPVLGHVAEILLSFAMTALLFAAVYRVIPTKRVPMRDALIGGIITAVFFTLGAVLTGAYVAHQATKNTFGAATSIVLLLVWVHYSAHSFLLGAAITAARAKQRGAL